MKTISLVFYALNQDLEPEAICFNEDWTVVKKEFKIWENVTKVIKDYAIACKTVKIEALPTDESPSTLPNEPRIVVLFVKMRQLSDPSTYHNIAKAEPKSLRRIVEKKNWRPNDHESISPPPELYYQPIITIGYEDIMDLYTEKDDSELAATGDLRHLESMRLDSRFKFFDSGIWHRYVPLYPRKGNFRDKFINVLEKMADWHQDHLYASNAARANLEFQLRMMKNSYIAKIGRTGHYEVVTPFKFHSETYIEEKIKALEAYFNRFQRSSFRLGWRLLLIDDFAIKNISSHEDRCILSKQTLIEKILDSKAFTITVEVPDQDNEIIDTCMKKLETNIFDVLLLDYLLGNTNKRKKKREYGHDFMMRLRSDHKEKGANLKIGPLGKYWICPISSFPFALKDKLWQLGIHPFDDLWYLSNGGDPICTPALFKYNLLSFFERQIEETFSDCESLSRLLNRFDGLNDHKLWAESLRHGLDLNYLRINLLKSDKHYLSTFAGSVSEVIPKGYQQFLKAISSFLNWFIEWDIEKSSALEVESERKKINAPEGYQTFLEAFWQKIEFFIDAGNRAMREKINNYNDSYELSFPNGRLERLPREISQCKSLISLNLSGNKLQYLPDSLDQLQYLGKLDLSNNQFTVFPEVLAKFKGRLYNLNLSNNPLKLSRIKADSITEVEALIDEGLKSIIGNQTREIRAMISCDEIKLALDKFSELLNRQISLPVNLINRLILLHNRFSRNKSAKEMRTDSIENTQIEDNQIILILLGLLEEFEVGIKTEHNPKKP